MAFIKRASATITASDLISSESMEADPSINERFKKFADELKQIAPKAKDFLYFSAIMMHAAEAATINDDGVIKNGTDGQPIKFGWESNGDSLKWWCTDKNIMPYKNSNCFVPGTKILMADGTVKNIEDIEINDEVITHKNRIKKVTEVFERNYDGNLLEIKSSHNLPLFCTPEHPIFVARNLSKDSNTKRALANNKVDYRFVDAKDVDYDLDHVIGPVLKNIQSESQITSGQARLLGLFAAEGCSYKKTGIVLSFSHLEYDNLAKETKELFEQEFPNNSITLAKPTPSQPTKCALYVSNVNKFFVDNVGQYSANKTLSKDIVFGSESVKKNFIIGWLEGDGHVDKQSGKLVGTTVSSNLASQITVMLNSLNINNTYQVQSPSVGQHNGREICGKYDVHRIKIPYNEGKIFINASNKLAFEKSVKLIKSNVFLNDYAHHSLIEKINHKYSGNVYNFEVEDDHSYVANNLIVHNCDIFPEKELVSAHKKWVGRPLCLDHKSSSVEAIRGVVVDTYYDNRNKRVIALCALDKVNYPDLARQVSSGYAASVSMGTAVGKAICSDCGNVAKIESDFCDHMRSKSCYGEINIDLSPIELSIVVNGADPNAKIRTIVASASEAIDKYADIKDKISNGDVNVEELGAIRIALQEITERLEGLETAAEQAKTEAETSPAYGATNSSQHMQESEEPSQLPNIQTPGEARLSVGSLQQTIDDIHNKLGEINTDLKTLPKESKMADTENKDLVQKEAYFQGAGGVNEPSPGKPKYEKENDHTIRDTQDKQMVGQMDTGPVDGMHPGPDSVSMSELERKKMLARAKADERATRRKEALVRVSEGLEKEGYYQGGGGDNEPSPGKPKYNKEDYKKNRDKQDKQMTGKSPFPNVGPIDGLYPNDLETKKKLNRASLKAKFLKAANPDGSDDQAESRWDVYADNKLVLTATVNDISGGRVDALYDSIATKNFGIRLLEKVKSDGVTKVAGTYKVAQAPMPAPTESAGAAAPPEAPGGAAPMAEEPMEPVGDEAGDPGETSMKIAEEIRDRASDLVEMLRASEGEAAEMGDEMMEGEAPVEPAIASLKTMRKQLNGALVQGAKQALGELKDHHEEMRLIANIFAEKVTEENKGFVSNIATDAFVDAKSTLAETKQLMSAFVKYARGTEALEKRAAVAKKAQVIDLNMTDSELVDDVGLVDIDLVDTYADEGMALDVAPDAVENAIKDVVTEQLGGMAADDGGAEEVDKADEAEANDSKAEDADADDSAADDTDSGDTEGLDTKEARAMQRTKIAQQGLKFMDLLNQAHPGGGVTTDLDVKPTGDLAKVETLEEAHSKHMDVASAPPKVRKMAEEIQRLITTGELAKDDVEQLISLGVDKEAVAYWHKLYNEAPDGGKEFATQLTKEKYAAAAEEDKSTYRVKLARAYELATDMQVKGMCDNTKSAFNQMVNEIMNWSDGAFDSIKRVVAQQEFKKEASVKIPEVGWAGSGDVNTQNVSDEPVNLKSQLEAAMSGRKY